MTGLGGIPPMLRGAGQGRQPGHRWGTAAAPRAARRHTIHAAQVLELLLASGEDETLATQVADQTLIGKWR
jgi:hypothetical protein